MRGNNTEDTRIAVGTPIAERHLVTSAVKNSESADLTDRICRFRPAVLQNEWSSITVHLRAPIFKTEKPAAAIQTNLSAIFVSMEPSRSTWLITIL